MASQVVAHLQNFQTSQKILISDTNCSICPETKTLPLAHTTNVDHAIFKTQHPPFLLVLVHRQEGEDFSLIFSGLCISIIQPSLLSSCSIIRFISSVRSSYSHPDLLLITTHPTFSDHTGPQHWTFTF